MKPVLCLSLFLASIAWADEATDRASITTTISWVNSLYVDSTPDFPDSVELLRGARGNFGTVVISKEPWGEATWFPAAVAKAPHFVVQTIRFVTPDVALVEGIDRLNGNTSVLFVLKKDGIAWRIASFKRIEDQAKTAP
jgi:hypothetical protein